MFCTGGIGGAKSYGGQIWDLHRVFDNAVDLSDPKPTRSWTVAPNYRICETLVELTLQVANDVFGLQEGKHFDFRKSMPQELDFRPMGLNHRMKFLSCDNPHHFVSTSLTHWRWSEVGVSKPDTYDKLMDRLRDPRSKIVQGLGDGSPEGMNHFADLANIQGLGRRDRIDEARNRRRFIVHTDDNVKHLAPGYLETLCDRYSYDPSRLKSYRYGLFVPFSKGTAYWNFVESRNVRGDEEIQCNPMLPIAFCWDFNVAPLAWTTHQKQVTQKDVLSPRYERFVAMHESSGNSRSLEDAVVEFALAYPIHKFRHTVIELHGDRSGYNRAHNTPGCDYDQIAKYLGGAGYQRVSIRTPNQNPEIRPTLEKMAAVMEYGMYIVHHRCRRLIDSFNKTTLKEGTWQIDKPSNDTWSHYGDSARYYVFEQTKGLDITNPNNKRVSGFSM